jgi:hypothetical protein
MRSRAEITAASTHRKVKTTGAASWRRSKAVMATSRQQQNETATAYENDGGSLGIIGGLSYQTRPAVERLAGHRRSAKHRRHRETGRSVASLK